MKLIDITETRSEMVASQGMAQGAKDRQRQKLKGYKDFQKKKNQKSKAVNNGGFLSSVFSK